MGKLSAHNEHMHELWIEDNLQFKDQDIQINRTEDCDFILMGNRGDVHSIQWLFTAADQKLIRMEYLEVKKPFEAAQEGWIITFVRKLSEQGIQKWRRALNHLVKRNHLY